jgi:hypothetical protein
MPSDEELQIKYKIIELEELKEEKVLLDKEIKDLQQGICELMALNEIKTFNVELGDHDLNATYVSSTKTKIDEVSLKKAIGARTFNTLTTRKLDEELVEKAILGNKIDAHIVSQCTAIVKSAPYIRLSTKMKRVS